AREANPTQTRLETALAAMDGGEAALFFASGMAAGAAVAQSLPSGSRILFTDDSYYAFRLLAQDYLERSGYTCELVPVKDLSALEKALEKPAALVWAETPSNPLMNVTDIEAVARISKDAGARLLVDGTFATPALQRPLELGADIVLHSTTKYLGGHSDVVGGALVFRTRSELFERTLHTRRIVGGVASPFSAWLVLRGARTLAARMRVHSENGRRVAEFLEGHPSVGRVHYPGLPSHEGHEVARRQMTDFGGMLSFEVMGGRDAAIAVVAGVEIFVRATSLGGVESLIEHRWSTEGPGSTTPEALIRVSVGLEHPDDLIEDLDRALAAVAR
ncbi:MAG: aminotransferase class I/II-fold pyridoxal phosphate-dependent enzyme, partial [Longimicrobiales bacterium]|nr:aminotransferase class I/II-fold pyridoxal phosphate-dependent enzyme [Longimicrobiales bacterium]